MGRMRSKRAPGVRILFDGLVLLSSLAGRRRDERMAQAQTRGAEGAYQLEVDGRVWHLRIGRGTARWRWGRHPSPRAVVSLSADDLFRLLTGQTSFVAASMSGRVKVQGDAHAAVLFGLLLARLRAMREDPRRSRRPVRWWLELAARHSGTPHRFVNPEVPT